MLDSADQAVERVVALRVRNGGHEVPEADVRRRFGRSQRRFTGDYLPLSDGGILWDNSLPPHRRVAPSDTYQPEEILLMPDSSKMRESPPREIPEMEHLGLEASRIATAKMLEHYRRMGIAVTPRMTLASPSGEAPNKETGGTGG